MPSFGKKSKFELSTCHPRIIHVMNEAIKWYDFSVIKGARSEEEQNDAFKRGASKLVYPKSYHNPLQKFSYKSLAVDIVPYPIDWENLQRFHDLSHVIKDVCNKLNETDLVWGYDKWQWDMPHWQLEIR